MGRFGAIEGLILFVLQLAAVAIALRTLGFPFGRLLLVTLATYLAAFIAHIIGFMLLPDDAPRLATRPVIALIWFAASALACLPFLRERRALLVQCGLACMLAYLLFAFSMDYLKPA